MFVCAFYGGLYGGAEGSFGVIDDRAQRQLIDEFVEVKVQLRGAALAVRRGDDALGRAEPSQNVGVLQRLVGEVIDELLLDQLPRQRS